MPPQASLDFPGLEGFLGTRASLVLDFLVVAMFGVLIVMYWSIYQVCAHQRFTLHKWAQTILCSVLMVAVAVFEIDIRLHGWEDRAAGVIGGEAPQAVWTSLYIHLVFAVSSFFLWPIVTIRALRNFSNPPLPGQHSPSHKFWGWLATISMTITAFTGWTFYYLAFVS